MRRLIRLSDSFQSRAGLIGAKPAKAERQKAVPPSAATDFTIHLFTMVLPFVERFHLPAIANDNITRGPKSIRKQGKISQQKRHDPRLPLLLNTNPTPETARTTPQYMPLNG